MNIYRVYPVLWNGGRCSQAQTVYAIDRHTDTIPMTCSSRPKEDPAYEWHSPTFHRLLPPPGSSGLVDSVTWANIVEWLSFVQTLGYTIHVEFSSMKPYNDIYISGA